MPPVVRFCGMWNSRASINKNISQSQIHNSLCSFLLFTTRWLICQRALVEESGFLCRLHSTMVLHTHTSPGDVQEARLWPQFRGIVSPHRHDHNHHYHEVPIFHGNRRFIAMFTLGPVLSHLNPFTPLHPAYLNLTSVLLSHLTLDQVASSLRI
jgi:hypothetical protein